MKVLIVLLVIGAMLALGEGKKAEVKCRNPAYCDRPCYLVPAQPCPRCYCPARDCQDIGYCGPPSYIDYCGKCPVCRIYGINNRKKKFTHHLADPELTAISYCPSFFFFLVICLLRAKEEHSDDRGNRKHCKKVRCSSPGYLIALSPYHCTPALFFLQELCWRSVRDKKFNQVNVEILLTVTYPAIWFLLDHAHAATAQQLVVEILDTVVHLAISIIVENAQCAAAIRIFHAHEIIHFCVYVRKKMGSIPMFLGL
ncbi:hypothetical protein NPIL_327881 [Nephila pilipes]|uniref:Uncharacterized protein n=1 Tax=Nephila pilipes TaxID=299642 RepID=A0A8X6R3Q0_NEPPI|nr:hypothetical protein NPIL_327881 [Nephila pilipes]